jgi:heme exporter protein D
MRLLHVRFTVRRMMVAVAVVALLLMAVSTLQRRAHLQGLADYHAERARQIRSSSAPIQTPDGDYSQPRSEAALRRAGYHHALAEKYDFAARYHWLPVAPDPPEPE